MLSSATQRPDGQERDRHGTRLSAVDGDLTDIFQSTFASAVQRARVG